MASGVTDHLSKCLEWGVGVGTGSGEGGQGPSGEENTSVGTKLQQPCAVWRLQSGPQLCVTRAHSQVCDFKKMAEEW